MAERPLYTLYKNLKAQNYDVPDDYNKFESALTRDGKGGADNRHAIYENLKAQNFDVPSTYERFYSALFEPRSRTSSIAKGGSVPMSAADRARFSAGAAAISASAQHTMNNAGRYNRLKQRKQKQQKDFGRVNLGTHQTPYGGDANNVVKDDFAYNPETGKAGAYVTSDNENVYSQNDAEQKQNLLDKYGEEWNNAVDMGIVPSELDKADPDLSDTDVAMRQMERRQEWLNENQDRRSKELNESMHLQGSPFVASGGAVAPSSFNTAISNEANRLSDVEYGAYNTAKAYNQMLRTTLLQELKEQKQRNENAGWWKDKWNDVSNYFGAMFNTMLDPKLYSQGVMDAAISNNLLQVKKGMEDGTIKKGSNAGNAAQAMLGAIQQQQGEAAKQQQYGSKAYLYGDISGRSLKFMADFALSGWRNVMTTGFTKAGEKVGEKMALGALGKWFTKNTGRVLGDIAGSAALAATNQLGSTYNNVIERYVGMNNENGGVTQDKNGDLKFNEGVSLGKAIKDGFGSATIENFSEMFGEYLPGAPKLLSKLGLSKVSSFFEKIGNNSYYKWLSNATNKSGIQGVMAEISEEEFGTALHAAWGDGDGSWSDFNVFTNPDAREKQIDTCLGMFYSVGFMHAPRTAVGAINAVQYFNIKHQVAKADKFGQMMFNDKWDEIKSKIDVTTNADLTKTVLDATRSDSMTAKQKGAVINYAMFLSKLRGFNQAADAKTKDKVEEGDTAPTLSNDLDDAYTEGHNADDTDKHNIQLEQNDKANELAAMLHITPEQLHDMADEDLEAMTGQDDKLDQAIYDYQVSTAKYQGVMDGAQDEVDMAAHQAAMETDNMSDLSRGTVRKATIKATGGLEDYEVYIISGNIATHDDGSIDVGNSDDMIIYYDPTTGRKEHADAMMFADLIEELPAADVKAQAINDAKENAIKKIAGVIDGTVEVGSQFSVTDADGTEHTYEVLADNGDGTAMITIDGNVPTELVKGENVQIPYSFADLQQMKDMEDQKRLEAVKTEREQMEKERAEQQNQETEQTQPSFDFNQILNDNGNVVLADVLGKDGNTKYPNSQLFLIRDSGAKAKVVELKSDGTLVPHAVNKKDVRTATTMTLDEYKQAFAESSMIEENSGAIEVEDNEEGKLLNRNDDGAQTEQNQPSASVTTSQEDAAGSSESKDTNISANGNENNESLTFEDGTPIPVDVNGEVDLSQTDASHAAEWYDNNLGEDADDWLDGEIKKAKKVLEQAKNKKLAGTKPSELVASKKEKEAAIADAQAHYDSAISIRDSLKERRIAKEENTSEGRRNLIEKSRRKFARLKSAVKDDAEAVSQLYRETIGSLLHRLYDGTGIDVTDTIPLTAEEYVASNLGAHSLNYEGTETSKGVKQETGLSREDFAKTQLLAADGKGTTIDALVHSLWENRPSNLESLDTQDIRNALIGVLNSGFKASEARNFVENIRIAQAENILEEQKRAQEDAAYAEQHKAEPEAELGAKSDEKAELKAKSEEKLDNESDNKSNDLSNESDNEKTNDKINDNINVPEDATDEAPLGAQRDESDLPFSAKENGKQQTTAERAADVEKNKVDDMKVVDNIVGQKTRKAFERLAKMMGANIQWQYSDKLGNGWIQETTDADGNVHRTIFITLDSSITEGAQFIFGHEMTHQIKNLNPAAYNELTQLVLDTYGSDAFDKAVDDTMQRYSNAGFSGRARDYYAEEVVADSVGEMIRDLNLAHTLAMKMSHPLLAAIHEILQKIKLAFFGTEYSDVTKNIIRSIEQAYVKTANGQVINSETGEDVSFSLRQKPEPKKKGIGYKVFVLKDGKLYPPMVANPDGAATPVGVWLDADAAPIAGESKTGRPQVKQGGKGTQGGSGKLAYRPGWHLGVVPYAIQFNRKDAEGNKTLFPKNFVFAEVEYAADVDYQEEARQEGINPSGKYQHSLAGLKHLPTDGYYMYRTNPNPETDPWVITGAMKVNRILTRAEQAELVKNAGREPQQIQEGDIVTDDVVNSINQEIAAAPKFSLKVYHGSGAEDGDTNYVIFKPEDMKITEHTKFSLRLKSAIEKTETNPSDAQKESGNYKKGHIKFGGYDYTIENPKGSTRSGKDADGKEWKVTMHDTYGYIRGKFGKDGDHLDMFINDKADLDNWNGDVFVVDQVNPDGSFDEHKVMYGYDSMDDAKKAYLANYSDGWQGLGNITGASKDEFDKWLDTSNRKLKPFADYAKVKFSLKDEEYLKAVEDGNMEKAQKMVNEAADAAGYSTDSSYQGTSAFNGAAPWGNGYFLTKDERKDAWDNGEFEGESTLGDYINDDIDGGNLEELTNAASYRAADPMRKEAIDNVRNAIQKKAKTITMYRSVPSDVKEGSFRNGDWVTPSRAYAVDNAKLHGWGDDYNIIEQKVPVDDVWFDGNDIAEWGYGREEDYINDTDFAYKNSKNNKKLLDAVTYDDNGNVIPLSQRFNEKNKDVRFSLKDEKTMFGMHNISLDKLRRAIKQGGFAAPSMGVIDSKNGIYSDYGEITLIPKAEKLAKRTGKNAGTFTADAWTPTYPQVERIMNKQGEKAFNTDMNVKLGDVDNGIYSNVRESWKGYLSSGDVRDGLYWHYLFDNGMNPETIYQTGKYDNDITNEVMRISDNGNKTDYTDKEVAELIQLMNKATGKDNDVDAQREKLKARIASAEKQGNHLLVALKKKRLEELEGVENFYIAADFVNDVVRNNRKNGKVDVHDTMGTAKKKVEDNKKLSDDFPSWLDKKTEEYGVEEMLYNGTTPSGKPKYIPNTIENAVKLMKKQGVAGGYTAFGSELGVFIAKNSPEVNTLAAMKNAKDKLIPFGDERHNQIKDKITKEFLELSDEIRVGSNNRYAFDDSGVSRMVELTDHKGNEKEYLKKAYNIEVSDEWMDRYNKLLDTIKKDYKVFYFETKFMRPYGLDEFEKAIVPSDTPSDVIDALKKTGIDVSSYERGNAEDRQKVTMDAINSSDNIRFSLKSMMEKPEGWKQANKKAIHIAEVIERDPKFSLKNLDGTLIKAGTYFSGGGLVEEGLKGIIDPVVAVEYDEKISGVYRNNFGQHIVTADVRDVDPKELVKQIDGEVEYFHASPVCKNYSQAKSNHAEVELDKETAASTAEFINAIKPKVVTIENVKGYKDSEAMKTITDALDANGYTWDADVYNAADYGGYTNRERLIVRAVRDGKLPEKPKKMARKSGWYEAVADIIPTLTEKKNGVAPWMDIRLKADGIDWRNIDKPLYVMGSAYADGKVPHAFADELLPTLRTKSGDVIVMPDGKVYRAMGRVLARVSGVSDDYKMPFSENLSHTIIGNGIPTQLTEHVIAPLLTGSDPKFSIRTYHGTGAKFDKFDLSHALEGEGSETFGHGVYVTNSSKIGREYAQRAKNRKMEDLYKNMRYPDGVKGDIFKRRVFGEMVNDVATGGSVASAKEFAKKRVGADANDIQRTLENLKDREKGTEYEQNLKNRLAEYKEGLKWIDSLDEDYLTQGNANRYDVDIPDDNGENYLGWNESQNFPLEKWYRLWEITHHGFNENEYFKDGGARYDIDRIERITQMKLESPENGMQKLPTLKGEELYHALEDFFNRERPSYGAELASRALSEIGFVGIKYPAGMIHGGAVEGDYNYVIFDENNANIVGNTRFSLRYDQFEHDLNQWKKDNNLPKDAQRPTIPQRNAGESAVDFLRRVDEYRKQMALWKTAPTYEQHLLSDDTALGEFNRELQRGSVLKRIAFQDSMLAIRKAQEAIMKEVGVDRLNMAEDAYTAENRSHGKGKNEFEEYNNEFLQPLRKAYHQMKKILGDSYDNVRIYMMAKHGLERDAQMAFKKSLDADFEDVAQRSAAYKAYKGDMNRIINDSDLEFGRVDFTTWRQRDNALRVKYSPSYMDYRYDKNGIAYDYSGLSALFDGSDFEEAAHKLVKDIEDKYVTETHNLWDATNAATKKILRDGYKAGMMSKDTYQYVRDMYSHYIPLRGWDGTTADQVWDYIGGGKGAFNQTLKKAHGRTSIADDPIAYIENMAESGILLNNKNWVKQHLMLLAQNHPTSLLTLSKAWYVKSTDANGNEEWIPATPQISSQMNSNQVKAAIDAFEKKMEQMAQAGDATQKRDGLNIAYPQTHSEEREHEVRVMKDGEEYVIYVNGDPQLAQAMNNTRAHRVSEGIKNSISKRVIAVVGRKMAAAYTSLSPLFIPSNYFRDLTMTLASTAIREDAKYNYLLRKNLATSWNLGFMLRDFQNGKLRDKVNNGNATPKEQMFYDFMMNGGETGFVSSLDVEDLKKKFKNDLKDLDRWKANPVKVGHTIMDSIEFLNRMIEDSNRFAVYMTSIQYGRSIDEAVNDAKDVTLNFNRKGTGEHSWQTIRNLYLFINPAVQSLQTLGALAKHHPFKFTAVTASWLASGVLVPIVNVALMQLGAAFLGGDGDDDKDWYKDISKKYWQFSKWDRRNNFIMWVPTTHEFVKIPLAQEFRAFYGVGDMIASKMMGGELAEESWSQYAEDLLGQVVDMLPLDPTGYDGNIAVSLMPNAIRPVFELAFNVDFTGKPLFKETEYNKYDPNFTKAYVGTPDWLVRVSRMVNSIGNDYPDVQQNSIDAFGDPRYNLNNPAVVDHVLSSYLGGAYTMGSQVLGLLTKSLNDRKEIKVADIPLFSKFVSNPDDRPVTKKQGDEFWDMKENHDHAANTLSKLKKQAKVDGDYSMLERFYGSEEYKQYKQDDVKVKKYEEDKKKERAEESGEEYRPHKLNAEDIYKAHATPKDDFEDLKLKQLYTKLNGFKTSYDLLVDTAPSQSDGYYNTNKAAIDAIDEIALDKQEISELKKGFLDDGKDAYNAEDMKQIRELRKKILAVLEKANKVVVASQKAKAEK